MRTDSKVFFFNDTATTEIYTLSLHDALPIWRLDRRCGSSRRRKRARRPLPTPYDGPAQGDAVQQRGGERATGTWSRGSTDRKSTRLNSKSRQYLVCRLLLEQKKPLLYPLPPP